MKTGYFLGAALAAAAAFGYANHASPPRSAAPADTSSLRGVVGSEGAGLPPGHPAIGSNQELPINGHVELGSDPGVPGVLLDNPGGTLPPGHPAIEGNEAATGSGDTALPPGHPAIGTAAPSVPSMAAHPDTLSTPAAVEVPKLARASGENGYLIADLFAKKNRLAGTHVRVHGMVTKVTPDVQGLTFLHVRDGSGDSATKTDDLAVTTAARPSRGDVVTFDGVLRFDVDLGIGYRYPALLENATVAAN